MARWTTSSTPVSDFFAGECLPVNPHPETPAYLHACVSLLPLVLSHPPGADSLSVRFLLKLLDEESVRKDIQLPSPSIVLCLQRILHCLPTYTHASLSSLSFFPAPLQLTPCLSTLCWSCWTRSPSERTPASHLPSGPRTISHSWPSSATNPSSTGGRGLGLGRGRDGEGGNKRE